MNVQYLTSPCVLKKSLRRGLAVQPLNVLDGGPPKTGLRGLTISVYLPRRAVNQGAKPQTRRINLVGLNRRPADGRVGDKGVCKLCARVHAQIMTGDLPRVLICAIDFASTARPNECAARPRAIPARPYWRQARTTPGTRQMALQTAAELSHRARPSRRPPALGHQ